jgi:hypothetical protein
VLTYLRFGGYASGVCMAAVMLVGCGGSQPGGTVTQGLTQPLARGGSSNGRLLYVVNGRNLLVFSFPQGKLASKQPDIGSLRGACSDKDGNVFVVMLNGSTDNVLEFAHGGTSPIATLTIPGRAANACAVDPQTNNLAVTFNPVSGSSVAIFSGESGTPQVYSTGSFGGFGYCGFDNKGNLFIDNDIPSGSPGSPLVEFKGESQTFASIALNEKLELGGNLQWDGRYLAAGQTNTFGHSIYHIKISGTNGSAVGATVLGRKAWGETWIENGVVAAATRSKSGGGGVTLYDYPSGILVKKLPSKDFQRNAAVFGLTVSNGT